MSRPVNSDQVTVPKDLILLPISRAVFRIAFKFLGGCRVSGIENIPAAGAALLCPNHVSDLDPVAVLTAVNRNDFNALAKSELFGIPLLGAYLRRVGALSITRDSADRVALRLAESVIIEGRLLLIFPEGRCSPSGRMQTVRSGAALLSLRTGCPIIPIGLRGTNNVLPYGALWPKFVGEGVTVAVGEPIYPSQYSGMPHRKAIINCTADLRSTLERLTGQQP